MSRIGRSRVRLGALTGALVVLTPLSQLGFVPVSPVLGAQLGIDVTSIGLAIGLYAVSAAVGTIVLGPLFDLVPARRILPWAVLGNLAVSVCFVWVPNLPVLLAGRVLAGLANSALSLTASVIVADAYRSRPDERDRAFSGLQTYISTGAISGLAIGGLCAGLGRPWLYFAVVAAYALGILLLSPVILRRMRGLEDAGPDARPDAHAHAGLAVDATPDLTEDSPGVRAHAVGDADSSLRSLLRDVGALLRTPQTILLLLAAMCGSWVLQSGHYSLSMLLTDQEPPVLVRTALTVMIPVGVLLGALVNQWSLLRSSPHGVYGRAFLFLPLACALLACSLLSRTDVVWAAALLGLGLVCGMLGPLQPAIMVGWYPGVRGSASAAINVAASLGAAVGPVAMGAIASRWALPVAVATSAGIAVLGSVLAAFVARGGGRPRTAVAAG